MTRTLSKSARLPPPRHPHTNPHPPHPHPHPSHTYTRLQHYILYGHFPQIEVRHGDTSWTSLLPEVYRAYRQEEDSALGGGGGGEGGGGLHLACSAQEFHRWVGRCWVGEEAVSGGSTKEPV